MVACFIAALVVVLATPGVGADNLNPDSATVYTPHDSIRIYGNAGFEMASGVTGGSGTPSDPYVIEGWDIVGRFSNPIEIWNTNAYAIIRDVYVHGGGEGINLVNATNVQILRVVADANGDGIQMIRSRNITLSDSNLTRSMAGSSGYSAGLALFSSDHVTLLNNRIRDNINGAVLVDSTNVTLRENLFTNDSLLIFGSVLDHFRSHDITPDNLVNDQPLLAYRDATGLSLDGLAAGELLLLNVTNAVVRGITIRGADRAMGVAFARNVQIMGNRLEGNTYDGLGVVLSDNVTVSGNLIRDNPTGAVLWRAADVTLANNTFLGNPGGVRASFSRNVTVTGNEIAAASRGIFLEYTNRSALLRNRVTDGIDGILISESSNVTVDANVVVGAVEHGIGLLSSRDNVVIRNYLVGGDGIYPGSPYPSGFTTGNVFYHNTVLWSHLHWDMGFPGPNTWDDGYPSGGNHWRDATSPDLCSGPAQDDCTHGDGILDGPYYLAPDNLDRYPLIAPWNAPANASFSASLVSGTLNVVSADASGSWDDHDPAASLLVRWDWEGDGLWDTKWSTARISTHAYPRSGDYPIRLEVRDSAGYLNITSRTFSAGSPIGLSISASPSSGPPSLSVQFHATVTGASAPVVYLWTFGDGGESHEAAPTHVYVGLGRYTATLLITDARGLEKTASTVIQVVKAPPRLTVTARPSSGVAPLQVVLNASFSGGVAPYSYGWTFGDGATSPAANTTHVYSEAGAYTARFVLRDANGALQVANVTITVLPPLSVASTTEPSSDWSTLGVAFAADASGGTVPYYYAWDFGDGSHSNLANPTHVYANPGSYHVSLVVTDAEGRTATTTFDVAVVAGGSSGGGSWTLYAVGASLAAVGAALLLVTWRRRARP